MRPANATRLRGSTATLIAAGALVLTGCGSASTAPTAPAGDPACQAQWKTLANSITSRTPDTRKPSDPSMLADRWNSVAAGLQYYATSATSSDCGDVLSRQRLSINALIDFGEGLQRFDMEFQRDQLEGPARAYLASPLPRHVRGGPVSKAEVRKALRILDTLAIRAAASMSSAWAQAEVVDLADQQGVEKTLRDLTYLGKQSPAFQQCSAAVLTIRKAIGQLAAQG